MVSKGNCTKCDIIIKESDSHLRCSGQCCSYFHAKCVNVSSRDLQIFENISGAKWFCELCLKYIDIILNINKQLENLKNHVNIELNNFKDILNKHSGLKTDNKSNENKSYANVTANEVVIIKPKNKQESKKTKEVIQKNLKPAALEVGITQLKDIKEGGVVIKCKSKEEQEKIKKAAEKKLPKTYQINAPELKNPCIKVVDIEDNLSVEDVINNIKKQNTCILHDHTDIKVKVMKKMKTKYMAIIECDPLTYTKILEEKYLYIDWARCRVFDYVNVFRCFKCAGFNHSMENCECEIRCLKCASNHDTENCTSDFVKCANCIEAKDKLKVDIDFNHSIYDITCPVYLKRIEGQRKKIRYLSNECGTSSPFLQP